MPPKIPRRSRALYTATTILPHSGHLSGVAHKSYPHSTHSPRNPRRFRRRAPTICPARTTVGNSAMIITAQYRTNQISVRYFSATTARSTPGTIIRLSQSPPKFRNTYRGASATIPSPGTESHMKLRCGSACTITQ